MNYIIGAVALYFVPDRIGYVSTAVNEYSNKKNLRKRGSTISPDSTTPWKLSVQTHKPRDTSYLNHNTWSVEKYLSPIIKNGKWSKDIDFGRKV